VSNPKRPPDQVSRHNSFNDLWFEDTGQLLVQAAVKASELAVIESHQVQNRRVQVANVVTIDDRFVAEFIRLAVRCARFDSAAGQEISLQVFLDAVVRIPVLLLISAAVINLNKANAPLDQPARDQTLPAKRRWTERQRMFRLGAIQAVHLRRTAIHEQKNARLEGWIHRRHLDVGR
jgi:hypothetical protein